MCIPCDQLRAEAANAVNFTHALDRLDFFVFTLEIELDGGQKASWMGKGPESRIDEAIAGDCFIGRRGRLWTSTAGVVLRIRPAAQAHRLGWKTGAHAVRQQEYRPRAANRKTVSITRRRHRRPRDQLLFWSRDGRDGGTVLRNQPFYISRR